MRALQFATATVNLASQHAFLFLATHGPIFIASYFFLSFIVRPGNVTVTARVQRRRRQKRGRPNDDDDDDDDDDDA
jgi:hypothetical protein